MVQHRSRNRLLIAVAGAAVSVGAAVGVAQALAPTPTTLVDICEQQLGCPGGNVKCATISRDGSPIHITCWKR